MNNQNTILYTIIIVVTTTLLSCLQDQNSDYLYQSNDGRITIFQTEDDTASIPDLSINYEYGDNYILMRVEPSMKLTNPLHISVQYDKSKYPNLDSLAETIVFHTNDGVLMDSLIIADIDTSTNTISFTTGSFSEFLIPLINIALGTAGKAPEKVWDEVLVPLHESIVEDYQNGKIPCEKLNSLHNWILYGGYFLSPQSAKLLDNWLNKGDPIENSPIFSDEEVLSNTISYLKNSNQGQSRLCELLESNTSQTIPLLIDEGFETNTSPPNKYKIEGEATYTFKECNGLQAVVDVQLSIQATDTFDFNPGEGWNLDLPGTEKTLRIEDNWSLDLKNKCPYNKGHDFSWKGKKINTTETIATTCKEVCCAEPITFTIDSKENCGCDGKNAINIGALTKGIYTITPVSGRVRTNDHTDWNTATGQCKGCSRRNCWAIHSDIQQIPFELPTIIEVETVSMLNVWYQDNGCPDNEGSITYELTCLDESN